MADGAPDPSPAQVDEMAQLVRPRALLTAVEWMQAQDEPICDRLWANVYRIALHAKHQRTQIIAAKMFLDRVDPERSAEELAGTQPRSLTITVVNSERAPETRHALEENGRGIRVFNSERDGA